MQGRFVGAAYVRRRLVESWLAAQLGAGSQGGRCQHGKSVTRLGVGSQGGRRRRDFGRSGVQYGGMARLG